MQKGDKHQYELCNGLEALKVATYLYANNIVESPGYIEGKSMEFAAFFEKFAELARSESSAQSIDFNKEVLNLGKKLQSILPETMNEVSLAEIVNSIANSNNPEDIVTYYEKLMNAELELKHIVESRIKETRYNEEISRYNEELERIEAEYKEAKDEALQEIRNSMQEITQNIEQYDQQYGFFTTLQQQARGYNHYQQTPHNYRQTWNNHKSNINDAESYETAIRAYNSMKTFVTESIKSYNSYSYNSYNRHQQVALPSFITQKNIEKRTLQAPAEKNNKPFTPQYLSRIIVQLNKYTNTQEACKFILQSLHICQTYPIKFGNTTSLSLPTIIAYDDHDDLFDNSSLIVKLDDLESSHFFQSFFGAINKKMSGILSVYEKAKTTTPGYLIGEQKEINKRVDKIIAKRFNELYGKSGNDAYRFDVKLDKEEISVSIFKGDDVVVLDDQSAGFKWFFNLYFNLLNGKILKSGDIVLMDEPAYNLSVKARKECAEFLRQYGEENGITFLVVTHDLFWIDSDFLNEVRIIKNREDKELKGVSIQNDFSRIESSDTDTFLEIKRAFGVDLHVFYPPSVRTIFVEGITDYNYLTTFKLLKEKESGERLSIAFLPIGGLGKEGEKEIVLEKLMAQCKEPILLVDADGAADETITIKKEKKYEKLEIIKLSDIDSKFKEIENLFSKNDMEKYGLETKSGSISSSFKKHILWNKEVEDKDKLEQSTKANFYKVLEHLAKNV